MAHLFVESEQIGHGPLIASLHILEAYLQRFPDDRCTLNTHMPILAGRLTRAMEGQIHVISHANTSLERIQQRRPRYESADLLLHVDQPWTALAGHDLPQPSLFLSQMSWCRFPDDPPPWEKLESLQGVLLTQFLGAWRQHPLGQLTNAQVVGPLFTPENAHQHIQEAWRLPAPGALFYVGGTEGEGENSPAQQHQLLVDMAQEASRKGGVRDHRFFVVGKRGFLAPAEMTRVLQRSDHVLATPGLGILHDHQRHAPTQPLQLLPSVNLTQFGQHSRLWEVGIASVPPTLGLEPRGAELKEAFQHFRTQLEDDPDKRQIVINLLAERIKDRQSMIDAQRYHKLFSSSGLPAIIDQLAQIRPAQPDSTRIVD